jgi:hypothetical protein
VVIKKEISNLSKIYLMLISLFILCGLLLACNLSGSVLNPDSVGTAWQNTQTALDLEPILDTLIAFPMQPTQSIDPTFSPTLESSPIPIIPTPSPTRLIPDELIREINFRTGGTSSFHQVTIKSGEQHIYSFQANEGQLMILTASSPNHDVFFGLKGVDDGQHLLFPTALSSYWVGELPKTQEYLITLITNNPDTYYFLSVEIPAIIKFQPGSDSIEIDGYIDVDTEFYPDMMTRVRYLVYASEGQTMTIELYSPNIDNLTIGVMGQQDGQQYVSYRIRYRSGVEINVPVSQEYFLDVYSTGVTTDFSLKISIK